MNPLAHLWESTLCAAAAALLVLALRRAPARYRHAIWLLASLKFLVPFSALVLAGRTAGIWAASLAPQELSTTALWLDRSLGFFALTANAAGTSPGFGAMLREPGWLALLTIWMAGAIAIAAARAKQARASAAVVHSAVALDRGREAEALHRVRQRFSGLRRVTLRQSSSNVEPAVVGLFQPVILWPAGLSARLTDAELDAILTHELCHVARHDNWIGYAHVAVETVFWFYPLVWWLGARLIHERERACDEEVVNMGADTRSYAEGILKVCGFCLRSPAAFVAGIGGSGLTQRVERIVMQSRSVSRGPTTRSLVAAVALVMAAPAFAVGFASAGTAAGALQERPTVYKAGNGVKHPVLVREVKPKYTKEAMEAKIQGVVRLAAVVLESGEIGDVTVTQSLDKEYGLDDEAVRTVRQWLFKPGTKDDKPVAVEIEIEMSFKLK